MEQLTQEHLETLKKDIESGLVMIVETEHFGQLEKKVALLEAASNRLFVACKKFDDMMLGRTATTKYNCWQAIRKAMNKTNFKE